jgi:phosphoribosylaminoimidazolecarboxamide formyltransferase / IMP cyclohydrolase
MAINRVGTIDDRVRVRTALASVSDKTGLDAFILALVAAIPDLRLLSTGGTYSALEKSLGARAARNLQQVSSYTGQPEMQGGLVKTLDFKIYLGLLSETYNPAHAADLARTGGVPIDLVVVNLYPFQETISRSGASFEDARGNIDIGGPCMVRAAAKNFHRVAVVTDPRDYAGLAEELGAHNGALSLATRYRLAQKAFRMTAEYDAAISRYLSESAFETARAPYRVGGEG